MMDVHLDKIKLRPITLKDVVVPANFENIIQLARVMRYNLRICVRNI